MFIKKLKNFEDFEGNIYRKPFQKGIYYTNEDFKTMKTTKKPLGKDQNYEKRKN